MRISRVSLIHVPVSVKGGRFGREAAEIRHKLSEMSVDEGAGID
ncbi:hypothetical protein ACFQBN_18285 [Cohnella cellulosilytica]